MSDTIDNTMMVLRVAWPWLAIIFGVILIEAGLERRDR